MFYIGKNVYAIPNDLYSQIVKIDEEADLGEYNKLIAKIKSKFKIKCVLEDILNGEEF